MEIVFGIVRCLR